MVGGATEVERLIVRIMTDATSYMAGMNAANSTMVKMATTAQAVGRKMIIGLTLPLMAISGLAVREFAKFDQAMTQSVSIMKGVDDEMRMEMEKVAKNLSLESVTAPEQLAKSYYYLASAGLSAAQSIAELETVNKFAIAGAFDMATATDLLTDAVTALGYPISDMTKLSDAFALSNEQANATMQQFSEAITNDAGVSMRNWKMELKTGMAILNAYASSGKKGNVAGSMMGRTLRLLSQAVRENADAFKKYNIKAIDEATGEYRNFIDIIADLERTLIPKTAPERGAILEELGFAALAQKAILPLIGMSKEMRKWEAEQEEAAGTTERIYRKQMESFSNQMKVMWNHIKVVGIELGDLLAPSILKINEHIKAGLKWWRALDVETKKNVVTWAKWIAILGPGLLIFGKLLGVLAMYPTQLMAMFKVARLAFGFLKVGSLIALLPMLKIVAIVGLIVGALGALAWAIMGTDGIVNAWKSATSWMKDFFDKALGFFANFKTNLGILVDWVKENWQQVFIEIGKLWLTVQTNMLKNIPVIAETIVRLWTVIQGWLSVAIPEVLAKIFSPETLNVIMDALSNLGKKIIDAILATAPAVYRTVTALVSGIVWIFAELPRAVARILQTMATEFKDVLMQIITLQPVDVTRMMVHMGQALAKELQVVRKQVALGLAQLAPEIQQMLDKAFSQVYGDVEAGRKAAQEGRLPVEELLKVLEEQRSKLTGLLEGYESGLKGPEFDLSRDEADKMRSELEATEGAIEAIGNAAEDTEEKHKNMIASMSAGVGTLKGSYEDFVRSLQYDELMQQMNKPIDDQASNLDYMLKAGVTEEATNQMKIELPKTAIPDIGMPLVSEDVARTFAGEELPDLPPDIDVNYDLSPGQSKSSQTSEPVVQLNSSILELDKTLKKVQSGLNGPVGENRTLDTRQAVDVTIGGGFSPTDIDFDL